MPKSESHDKPCPNCGHCPTCGRSNRPVPVNPWPWYPWGYPFYRPYWSTQPQYINATQGGLSTAQMQSYSNSLASAN